MLDIKYIRENPEKVQDSADKKGYTVNIAELLKLDEARRSAGQQVDALREKRNAIAGQMKGGKPSPELIEQGKASMSMVRVVQADGTAKPQPVLVGLNNRVTAQVIKGLKQGDQVVIADASDTSNDAAKRSNRVGGGAGPVRM